MPESPALSQAEIDALLARYGVPPVIHAQHGQVVAVDDPAAVAAAKARARAERAGKPLTQWITPAGDRIGQLFALLAELKAKIAVVKPYENEARDIGESIKAQLRQLDPQGRKIQLFCEGRSDGAELRGVPKTSVDMALLKHKYPEAYAECVTTADQFSLYVIGG
jgi:hypothetical protein